MFLKERNCKTCHNFRPPVAGLPAACAMGSQIHTRGVGIEPEQAAILIGELRAVIERMESQLPDDYMTLYGSSNGTTIDQDAGNVFVLRR